MPPRPGTLVVSPPKDGGAVSSISVFGCRSYTCQAGQTIDVPYYDAFAMEAQGWIVEGAASGNAMPAALGSLSIVSDGNRCVLVMTVSGKTMYVGGAGLTAEISQAIDIRGPAAVVGLGSPSDPAANLTLDPVTGDVFQTTGS